MPIPSSNGFFEKMCLFQLMEKHIAVKMSRSQQRAKEWINLSDVILRGERQLTGNKQHNSVCIKFKNQLWLDVTSFREINEHDETTKNEMEWQIQNAWQDSVSESGGTYRRLRRWWQYWRRLNCGHTGVQFTVVLHSLLAYALPSTTWYYH